MFLLGGGVRGGGGEDCSRVRGKAESFWGAGSTSGGEAGERSSTVLSRRGRHELSCWKEPCGPALLAHGHGEARKAFG